MSQQFTDIVVDDKPKAEIIADGATSVINSSKHEQEFVRQILRKRMPTYRQAYSDRTAWLMSCLSELAYVKFNPLCQNTNVQQAFDRSLSALIESKKLTRLATFIESLSYDAAEQQTLLEHDLKVMNLTLAKTFDRSGTQAIIATTDNFVVLAFRGTESTSVRDIKADCKATQTSCTSGGKVHQGFNDAYELVANEIQDVLDSKPFNSKPLFITGHSLGGALATIAAKRLSHQAGIAGCYTFGSPRVGNTTWVSGLRTPVYRMVNAVDAVTMLPPGGETIEVGAAILCKIPFCNGFGTMLQRRFGGYLHSGDMRYLTNCASGDYEGVELLYSVSWLYRFFGFFKKNVPSSNVLKDHSISIYRKKLAIVARQRNLD